MQRSIDLPQPKFEFLFRLSLSNSDPVLFGSTSDADEYYIPYESGQFSGPKYKGTLQKCGGDWISKRTDGVEMIDGKYVLRCEDKTLIGLSVSGARKDGEYMLRVFLDAGKNASELNSVVALGRAVKNDRDVSIDVFILK